MNILHISPYLPSNKAIHAGGVCMAREIETLEKLGHKVYCCSFYQERYDSKCLADCCDVKYFTLNSRKKIVNCLLHPFTAPYFASRNSRAFYKEIIRIIKNRNIEVIHAEYAAMGVYIKVKKKFPNIKFNLVLHDVTAQSYQRKYEKAQGIKKFIIKHEYLKVLKNEKNAVNHADSVMVFCEKDKLIVKQLYSPKNVLTINTYFGLDRIARVPTNFNNRNGLCFMGQMGRHENEEAALRLINIYNRARSKLHDVPLFIIGANPPQSLLNLVDDNIKVCGYVPNIEEIMAKCKIAIFPLISGAGIKIKVLTGMALGIPTITTSVGAEGIDESGDVLNIANTDDEIIETLLRLLKNNELYVSQAYKIKEYVVENFSWKKTEDAFIALYGDVSRDG